MRIYSFKGNRIGDRIASAYLLSYYKETQGLDYLLIEHTQEALAMNRFPVAKFFPELSDNVIYTNSSDKLYKELTSKFEPMQFHNLWISAPSLKQDTGYRTKIVLPEDVKSFSETIKIEGNERNIRDYKCVVINHPLIDAPYNIARNVNLAQWKKTMNMIRDKYDKEDVIVIDVPAKGLSVQQVIGLLSLGDIFIGCDTGFSHLYSALYNYNPIIAIYPDETSDREAFEWEREKYGYSHSWCSDPILSFNYKKFILKDNKFDEEAVIDEISKKIENKISL